MSRDIPTPTALGQAQARPAGLPQAVSFTEAQLAWLDQQFPEPEYLIGTDEKRFMVQSIQRGVIHSIRKKLAKASKEA